MNGISYILPIDKYSKEYSTYVKDCLDSVEAIECDCEKKLIIVGPANASKEIVSIYDKGNYNFEVTVLKCEETDFFKLVNTAVDNCETDYFSVIEFDDVLYAHTYKVSKQKMDNGASVIMPINILRDTDNNFLSFANEIALSPSFIDDLGVVTLDSLLDYMDFNVTGAYIKKEDFLKVGGLKPSLKIASWYEFLLRTAYNGNTICVVPKVCYVHTTGRDGSYMVESSNTISQEEGMWLINTAKQEYFFNEDRNKSFEEEKTEKED